MPRSLLDFRTLLVPGYRQKIDYFQPLNGRTESKWVSEYGNYRFLEQSGVLSIPLCLQGSP
jgi:hypothetical protein